MKEPVGNKTSKVYKKKHAVSWFLIISAFFWFLTKLSDEYVSVVVYKLTYKNLPVSKLFQDTPAKTIELRLKSSGFKLLGENINQKTITLDLQNVISKGNSKYYVLTRAKHLEIQRQLRKNIQLMNIPVDTIFFQLGINKLKKVPVIPDLDIRFKSGYNFVDKVLISPDSIEIKGPEIQIDKIKGLKLEPLKLENVFEDFHYEVKLQLTNAYPKIDYSAQKVDVIAKVEKITEGSFEVNFFIEGTPEGAKVITFQKTVKVVFQVGISNYSKISAKDFKVKCNYTLSQTNNYDYLTPEIVEKPSLVNSVKLSPSRIEYLIQK